MRQIGSQTRIIATLGPATNSKDDIRKRINEGVDVIRLNFSHSTVEEHSRLIKKVEALSLIN